jgi:hypothetical protein
MPPRPLSLTDDQLQVVMSATKSLAAVWHDRFVRAVADELIRVQLRTDRVTDDDVREAVATMLGRISGGEAA